jgi:hypothetical protein
MSRQKAVLVIDAILRKQRYVRDHPQVRITHLTAPLWHWTATWPGADGGTREAVDYDLGRLLDALEVLRLPGVDGTPAAPDGGGWVSGACTTGQGWPATTRIRVRHP